MLKPFICVSMGGEQLRGCDHMRATLYVRARGVDMGNYLDEKKCFSNERRQPFP